MTSTSSLLTSRRRLLNRLAAMVLIPLALLAASELLARAFFAPVAYPPDPIVSDQNEKWSDIRRYHPTLFWELRPGVRQDEIEVNEQGLRGPPVGPKPAGEFRILSLGESTTFARGVDYDDCYSARLERLVSTIDGRRTRVLNAGVPGYTLLQGTMLLEERGLDLELDGVLLYFGTNDFLPVAYRARRDALVQPGDLRTDWQLYAERSRPLFRAASLLLKHSQLARQISARLAPVPAPAEDSLQDPGNGGGGPEAGDGPDAPRDVRKSRVRRVPDDDRLRLLHRVRQTCARRGLRLLIVVPWYLEMERHAPLLRQFALETGTPLCDLPRRLADVPPPKEQYFQDDVHPNAEGHRRIAVELAEAVRMQWK